MESVDRYLDGPISQVKLWLDEDQLTTQEVMSELSNLSKEIPDREFSSSSILKPNRVVHLVAGVTVGYALLYWYEFITSL